PGPPAIHDRAEDILTRDARRLGLAPGAHTQVAIEKVRLRFNRDQQIAVDELDRWMKSDGVALERIPPLVKDELPLFFSLADRNHLTDYDAAVSTFRETYPGIPLTVSQSVRVFFNSACKRSTRQSVLEGVATLQKARNRRTITELLAEALEKGYSSDDTI